MANEVRGILYETVAQVALERAIKIANLPGKVYWHEKPESANVIPDFTIGTNPNRPSHVLMITASGAARNSEVKAWRNLGELQEIKGQLPNIPILINVYFLSEVKRGILETANRIYDTTLHITDKPYFAPLQQWVQKNIGARSYRLDQKTSLFLEDCEGDKTLDKAVNKLAKDLSIALRQRKKDLEPLWTLMRADFLTPKRSPAARQTYVRRGLAKLLVLEPELRQKVYANHKRGDAIPGRLPNYVFELDLFTKSIVGARLTDNEILNVMDLLGVSRCEELVKKAPAEMSLWTNTLRNLDKVAFHVDFVNTHYEKFIDPNEFENLLIACYNNPAGLSGISSDSKVWVYEIVMSLLKAKSGLLQGYGVARLAEDTGVPEFGNSGFVIPPFVQRAKILKPEHLRALSRGLSQRFRESVARGEVPKLREDVSKWVIKENLEDRLIPYRNFEPVLWLLENELTKAGKTFDGKSPVAGWINDYAGIGQKSSTTPFVRAGNTLIHWKSSHEGHANDKAKELCGRACNVKYQYSFDSRIFSRRKGIEHLALIVDGDWTDRHLEMLAKSGWDIIVYPDEIDKLIKQIV